MAFRRRLPGIAVFAAAAVLLPLSASAQLVVGQYEDEAPYRTWNSFPFISAAALGRGGTAFAAAGEASAYPANPAVLPSLPRFTLALGGSDQSAAFSKYGPVNTGVFLTGEPVSLGLLALDIAGLTYRAGRWAFGASVSLAEIYDRPPAEYIYESRGVTLYKIRFEQTGVLRIFNLSAGCRLGHGLSLGIGLNLAEGRLERHFSEEWTSSHIAITDDKTESFSGLYLNGGLAWEPGPRFRLAAVFRTPYRKKAEGESRVGYQSPGLAEAIVISGSAEDTLRQPFVAGIGASADLLPRLRLSADLAYVDWPSYEVSWFEDPQPRDYRGVLKAGLGLEHVLRFSLFGGPAELWLRAGLTYDPQPMSSPASAYFGATAGTGIRWRGLVLEVGIFFARESGSEDDLHGSRAAISLGYAFGEKR